MGYEQPTYTAEEILASIEDHAAHWENEARYSPPDVAFQCRDYAKHLRTIGECLQMVRARLATWGRSVLAFAKVVVTRSP